MKDPKNRKVFICFLGTNNYVLCNYCFGNKEENHCVKNVRFVQEAIVRHEFTGWTKNDRIFVFLTDAAKKANWVDGKPSDKDDDEKAKELPNSKWGWQGGEKWGLETQLKKLAKEGLFPEEIIVPVDVEDDSFSEEAFWSLFNKINEQIEPNDEIYLDFTSGFRSLSMFGMVLLTYLKNTKNVSIGEIYYGAFEKLGPVPKVKEMPVEERNAPVLKLKEFSTIMDFSNAANAFVNYGNGRQLCDAIQQWTNTNRAHKIDPELTKNLQDLANVIKKMTDDLQTCRGYEICTPSDTGALSKLQQWVEQNSKTTQYRALGPIVDSIQEKYQEFSNNNGVLNGFKAAKWCLEHGMYQQSVTFFQESIVTHYTKKVGMIPEAKDHRKVIELFLTDPKNGEDSKWKVEFKELENDGFLFVDNPNDVKDKIASIPKQVGSFYKSLTSIRNDFNHAGFLRVVYKKDGDICVDKPYKKGEKLDVVLQNDRSKSSRELINSDVFTFIKEIEKYNSTEDIMQAIVNRQMQKMGSDNA
ncbi:TIGR02221 family CRISPR-associated protein [uncultured Fibrobacter sp.]|uniref:TIGR02221 family CRISPR-associated protein n=1 Tax=uncultured Fibrobacter sp. TaxID=261512 RepID=UPI002591E8F2|nr:TIGR02221 family CRISPR-associated protein [uncultured Fibrobacter sp.]